MARNKSSLLLKGFSGAIGKQIVVKRYGGVEFLTKYPDRSRVKHSAGQKKSQSSFALAVIYAKNIINDPEKKAEYKKNLQQGERVYNAAIKEYLAKHTK